MQVFINEKSLHGQFEYFNIAKYIKTFLIAIEYLNSLSLKKLVLTSSSIYYRKIISNELLTSNIPSIHTIKTVLIQNLKNTIKWEDQQLHSKDAIYDFNNDDQESSSVAEITERKLRDSNLNTVLINFSESLFQYNLKITVIKDFTDNVLVECVFDLDTLQKWLIVNGLIDINEEYDVTSSIPPHDFQTVLVKSGKFEITKYPLQQGRKVYRRTGTNELWVVDNSSRHANPKAHIEVFDQESRKHLGTSLYNEIKVRPEYKVENRFISLS